MNKYFCIVLDYYEYCRIAKCIEQKKNRTRKGIEREFLSLIYRCLMRVKVIFQIIEHIVVFDKHPGVSKRSAWCGVT